MIHLWMWESNQYLPESTEDAALFEESKSVREITKELNKRFSAWAAIEQSDFGGESYLATNGITNITVGVIYGDEGENYEDLEVFYEDEYDNWVGGYDYDFESTQEAVYH